MLYIVYKLIGSGLETTFLEPLPSGRATFRLYSPEYIFTCQTLPLHYHTPCEMCQVFKAFRVWKSTRMFTVWFNNYFVKKNHLQFYFTENENSTQNQASNLQNLSTRLKALTLALTSGQALSSNPVGYLLSELQITVIHQTLGKVKQSQWWQQTEHHKYANLTAVLHVKWYMKCFIYWTVDLKSSELWSSQLWTQFKQLRKEAWKSQDFNGVWTHDLAISVRRSNQLSYEATDVGNFAI